MKIFLPIIFVLLCSVVYAQDTTTTARNVAVGVSNSSSTGTTKNRLAKLTGAPSKAVLVGDGDTGGAIGIVVSGAGTTGIATIATSGVTPCVFDNATTANDYVSIGATGGRCHDAGSTYPTSGQILGQVLSTNLSAGTYNVLFNAAVRVTGVVPNSAITGATKTKITYDSKGLVTSGTDIGASDLPSGIDAAKLGNGSVSNTEYQRLDGVSSAIQTQLDSKFASSNVDTDSTFAANSDSKVPSQKAVKSAFAALPVGVQNSAGAGVIPVTQDAAHLIGGSLSDDGNGNLTSGAGVNLSFTIPPLAAAGGASLTLTGGAGGSGLASQPGGAVNINGGNAFDNIGDADGGAVNINGGLGSNSGVQGAVNITAPTITNTAATSFSVVSPLFGAGDNGAKFLINGVGKITSYNDTAPLDGDVLIGRSSTGAFELASLAPGTGISVTNGAGSITISTTGASPTASYLAADYTNATASFTNIALSVTLGAGKKYSFVCQVFVSDSVAADGFSIDFNGGSATATNFIAGTSTSLVTGVTTGLTGTYSNGTVTGTNLLTISGSIEVNAGGTFIVRAKQSSHTAGTLTVSRGSTIVFTEIL